MVAIRGGLWVTLLLVAGFASACLAPAPSPPEASSCTALPKPPDTLLKLAECCAARVQSNPSCRAADPQAGYVILKDNSPRKPQSYMILPTAKVTGIDDPLVSSRPVVDFWQRGFALAPGYLGHPTADTALAINSAHARTQNQLHIHISCVRPDVRQALLEARIPAFPAQPIALPMPPHQHVYRVVKVNDLSGSGSPFLLVQGDPAAKADMAAQSIAVVGSAKPGEYYVLSTRRDERNPGFAEELLDQRCSQAA